MTVCIAAICEQDFPSFSPKIVFCADRQISTGINNFESGVPKISALTNYCYVMISSDDFSKTSMVIEEVRKSLIGKFPKIEEIVDILSNEFRKEFDLEREKEVLAKFGLDYEKFNRESKFMNPILLKDISDSLENFESKGSEIIVMGLDPEPHIYVVDEKGKKSFEDRSGFTMVGGGFVLAFSEMTRHEPSYNPREVNLSSSLIRVYRAKKVAERVGGVGSSTDLGVLYMVGNEVYLWKASDQGDQSKKALAILDETIREVKTKESEVLNKSIMELDKVFTTVEEETPDRKEPKSSQ